jgi:hypothetical protein
MTFKDSQKLAVIIQLALQISQAQGKVITGQYIFQLANQIKQDLH